MCLFRAVASQVHGNRSLGQETSSEAIIFFINRVGGWKPKCFQGSQWKVFQRLQNINQLKFSVMK